MSIGRDNDSRRLADSSSRACAALRGQRPEHRPLRRSYRRRPGGTRTPTPSLPSAVPGGEASWFAARSRKAFRRPAALDTRSYPADSCGFWPGITKRWSRESCAERLSSPAGRLHGQGALRALGRPQTGLLMGPGALLRSMGSWRLGTRRRSKRASERPRTTPAEAPTMPIRADVAQLVEQRFRKPQVVRSIRIAGSIIFNDLENPRQKKHERVLMKWTQPSSHTSLTRGNMGV